MINLKQLCDSIGFTPKHIFEVGVCEPHDCHVLPFLDNAERVVLIEPHPIYFARLTHAFSNYPQVKIFNYAVWKDNEDIEILNRNASTFVRGVNSPAIVNDGYQENDADSFKVKGIRFGVLDTGKIDLFSIDTEGCEWYAIRELKSRPRVICVETHGMQYKNPFYSEIFNWAEKNGYKVLAQDVSDTVFYLP